jgi:hypothetical protein
MNSLTWPQVPWLARIIAWRQPRTQKKGIVEGAVGQKSACDEWLTVPEMLARGIEITPEGPNSTPEDGDLAANLEALYGKKYRRGGA